MIGPMAPSWIAIFEIVVVVTNVCHGFATNKSDIGKSVIANLTEIDEKFRTTDSNVASIVDEKVRSTDSNVASIVDEKVRTTDSSIASIVDEKVRPTDSNVAPIVDEKLRSTDSNNASRLVATKEPTKNDETCSSCSEDPTRATGSNDEFIRNGKLVTIDDKNVSEVKNFTTKSESSLPPKIVDFNGEAGEKPRNVVLLLIDNTDLDTEDTWKTVEAAHDFSVHGSLKNCRNAEASSGLQPEESVVIGGGWQCDCDRFLRANVGTLLAWARHEKDMTIGAVSATNFTFPSPLGYASLPIAENPNNFDVNDETNIATKEMAHRHSHVKPNVRWIDLRNENNVSNIASSNANNVIVESAAKQNGSNVDDGMWDVFDMFARIRMAFFRALMSSIGILNGPDDGFFGGRSFATQPSVTELVTDTFRELKSVDSDGGFVMAVAVPSSEFSNVVEVLRNEVSIEDTLMVVSGMCSDGHGPVPFLANGPGAKLLREARNIWDLPLSIRSALSDKCRGKICKNKRHVEPRRLPSGEKIFFTHDYPQKRIVRIKKNDDAV